MLYLVCRRRVTKLYIRVGDIACNPILKEKKSMKKKVYINLVFNWNILQKTERFMFNLLNSNTSADNC